MRRWFTLILPALIALIVLLLTAPVAQAEEITCTSSLGAVTVDNLRVPQNGSCQLNGTKIEGTLKVERNATLNATTIHVIGNVQAENAALVKVRNGTVGGSIQIKQGGAAEITDTKVNGDIQFDSNGKPLVATGNTVGGNIQVMKNNGGVHIAGNVINGNLQCKENRPPPSGGNNVVHGSAEDQCEQLEGGDGGGDDGGAPPSTDECDDDDDGDDDDQCTFVPNQVVIKLDRATGVTINLIHRQYGTRTIQMLLGSAGIYLVQTPAGVGVQTLVAQLRNDSRILYAEPNFYGHAPEGGGRTKWAWAGDNPSPDGDKYANALLNLEQAHAISKGDGVVVAVLDTGMQLDHPLLAGRWTAARYDFVDDDAVPDEAFATLDRDGDGFVDESAGHGTHVAAIVHRAAPEAQIMPLRVLDASGRGNVFLIAEAVLFAAQNGAHVINLSLGTTRESALLSEMIEDAITEQGIVVVAAAGNLNGSQRQYPAATDGVLAVTAVDQNKARAGFANYGSWVDIAAPGVSIFSAFPIDTYAFWDGTSMATPFIAGQAALLRSLDPSLSATQIENYILATADPLGSGLGAGLANFAASLAAAPTPANPPGNDNDPAQGGTLPAPTEETTCNGSLGAVTVDNLRVPQNGSCNLEGTRVEGTIYVENGATLTALRIRVIGNIQAEGAAAVNVATASTVGGSIQVKQGAAANINDVAVTGDIQFESNSAALKAIGNTVGGNIQVVQNTGGVEISRNVIDGNLQCKENNPAPTGGDNVVHGSAEDQCANLGGGTISPPTVLVIQAYLPMIQR